MIGIIGQGFVGNAIYQKFKGSHLVVNTYDLDSSKCNSSIQETMDNEIVFICLPTPMNANGTCHTDIVEEAISRCFKFGVTKTVVIKSTVTPGTTAKWNKQFPSLNIVFNPEFLTERNAVSDFNNTSKIILGGPKSATGKIKTLYSKVFPKAKIIRTESTHAEMVKYVTNTYLAAKVAYANEIFKVCESLDIDYDTVIEYATLDNRLGDSHWQVPGHDGQFGFGGHCYPKDLLAMINLAEQLKVPNLVLKSVWDSNQIVREEKDWEKQKGRAVL